MIIGITLIALAIPAFLLYSTLRKWNMFSYIWSTLGYAPETNEEGSDNKKELSGNSAVRVGAGATSVDDIIKKLPSLQQRSPQADVNDTTPKAEPRPDGILPSIPTFSLQPEDDSSDEEDDNLPPPSFPAMNSAQRASAMPVLKIPTLKPLSNGSSVLMPPPPRPMAPPARTIPSTAAGLRIPTTGPLPNRGLVPDRNMLGSSIGNSLATPQTTATKTPNPRQKVLLKPGHSPLDWADLKRSGKNLSSVDRLIRVTPSLLRQHNGRKGMAAWSSYQGKVYNISPYLPYHPGGEGELRRVAGKEGGKLFNEVHPWVNWENMLEGCMVGIIVSESEGLKDLTSPLDEMD